MTRDNIDFHERYSDDHRAAKSSEKSFGLVFAGFFFIFGALDLYRGEANAWYILALALTLLVVAYTAPIVLRPFNYLWIRLGEILFVIVSPVVMGLLFLTTIIPIGLLLRAFGKDPLGLKWDRSSTSYWLKREPPGPAPESMRQQF